MIICLNSMKTPIVWTQLIKSYFPCTCSLLCIFTSKPISLPVSKALVTLMLSVLSKIPEKHSNIYLTLASLSVKVILDVDLEYMTNNKRYTLYFGMLI